MYSDTITSDYLKWNDSKPNGFQNFMELTSAPQRNPYGLTGNPEAMKYYEIQKPERPSTQNNPFMNPPIEDYDEPQNWARAEPECGKSCKKNFYRSLFQTPDDALWNRQASERQFYTVANSSIPNEQVKFAEWLYGNNQVGKSGTLYDRYGYPYTADSLVSTGNNAASPQNGGQLDNNYGTPTAQGTSPWINNPNYGYGFGGIQGGIPYPSGNIGSPMAMMSPYPLAPVFPSPVPVGQYEQIPQAPKK